MVLFYQIVELSSIVIINFLGSIFFRGDKQHVFMIIKVSQLIFELIIRSLVISACDLFDLSFLPLSGYAFPPVV